MLIHNPPAKLFFSSWQSPAGTKRWTETRSKDWKLDPNICGDTSFPILNAPKDLVCCTKLFRVEEKPLMTPCIDILHWSIHLSKDTLVFQSYQRSIMYVPCKTLNKPDIYKLKSLQMAFNHFKCVLPGFHNVGFPSVYCEYHCFSLCCRMTISYTVKMCFC